MEHLNKRVKQAASHLGPNVLGNSIQRIGRCIGELTEITQCYDKENGIYSKSSYHTKKASDDDVRKIIEQLEEADVFVMVSNRSHKSFKKFKHNVLNVEDPRFHEWLASNVQRIIALR